MRSAFADASRFALVGGLPTLGSIPREAFAVGEGGDDYIKCVFMP